MASSKKNDGVVPVEFLVNTSYGVKGSEGYIPESFADKWIAKGLVKSLGKKVSKKKVEEVPDEVSSEGESADVGFVKDETVFDGLGESSPE